MNGIEFEITTSAKLIAHYIEVDAEVRYWEDASVNFVDDVDGTLIPFKKEESWCPIIELVSGKVVDWPSGIMADIHYKVCDAGQYWLLDENKKRIAKWKGYYVPNDILGVGERGYGDYIIMTINDDGQIEDWEKPEIDGDEWVLI